MTLDEACTSVLYLDDPFAFGVFVVRQLKVGPGHVRWASCIQDAVGDNAFSLFDGTMTPQAGTSPTISGRTLVDNRFGPVGPVWIQFDVGLVVRSPKGAGDIYTFVVWQ